MDEAMFAGGSVMMILLFLLIALVPTILSIVLFFKVWFMTNDVSKIKDLLQELIDIEHPYVDDNGQEIVDIKNKP